MPQTELWKTSGENHSTNRISYSRIFSEKCQRLSENLKVIFNNQKYDDNIQHFKWFLFPVIVNTQMPDLGSLSTDSLCASLGLDTLPSTTSQVCLAEDSRVSHEGLAEDLLSNEGFGLLLAAYGRQWAVTDLMAILHHRIDNIPAVKSVFQRAANKLAKCWLRWPQVLITLFLNRASSLPLIKLTSSHCCVK